MLLLFVYNESMKKESTNDMNSKNLNNPSHKHEIPRLNRAIGQLEGIKKMIEEQRYCPDIIVQLKAVRSAIKHIESNILKTHLEECVAKSFSDSEIAKEKIMEIKTPKIIKPSVTNNQTMCSFTIFLKIFSNLIIQYYFCYLNIMLIFFIFYHW